MNDGLKTRPRITWSMQERDEWVALYRESGLTVDEFCRQNDFSKSKLTFWLDSLEEGPAENAFVEVPRDALAAAVRAPARQPLVTPTAPIAASCASNAPVAAAPITAAAVALQLPSGMRIEIPVGLDMTWFGHMLQAIVDAGV